jgi:hypothetical protein
VQLGDGPLAAQPRRCRPWFANSIKSDLEAQIGNPSPAQQILIKLIAIKVLRCEMMYD